MARNIYISPIYGNDNNSGLVDSYPLSSLDRAEELYGEQLTQTTYVNLACGEVIRGCTRGWAPQTGALLKFQPWQRTPGDLDRLGRPIISGGSQITDWTQYSDNLWYSEQYTIGLISAKSTDANPFVPSFPYGWHARAVVMVNGVVYKRRDGLRLKGGGTGVGNPFYTGTFNPETDTLNSDEWALDLSRIDFTTGAGVQRVWIGFNPEISYVEISTQDTPVRFQEPVNLELENIELRCSINNILGFGDLSGINRRIYINNCKIIGSGNNGISLSGGNVVALRNTQILHCFNNNITQNKGNLSVTLIEGCLCSNYSTFGTLPNGLTYDDRCTNDALVLHGSGGSDLTIRDTIVRYAAENGIDILDNYNNVLVDNCDAHGAGQNVFISSSRVNVVNSRFWGSARGMSFTFHSAVSAGTEGYPYNPNATAAGSTVEKCIIVDCGNPDYGTTSGCAGIEVHGAAGSLPVVVSRCRIVGSANADRPVITIRSKRETRATDGTITNGTWYEPCGLQLINCTIDHAEAPTGELAAIQNVRTNSPPDLSTYKYLVKGCTFAPGGVYSENGVEKDISKLVYFFGNKNNTVEEIDYYNPPAPTHPAEVIDVNRPLETQVGRAYAKRLHVVTPEVDEEDGGSEEPDPDPTVDVVAQFSFAPSRGEVPLTVGFNSQATGDPAVNSHGWSFKSDGTINATTATPSYTYTEPGTYTITYTAGNGVTTDSIQKEVIVDPKVDPPDEPDPEEPDPVVPSLLNPTSGKWTLQANPNWPFNATWYSNSHATPPTGDTNGNVMRFDIESSFNSGNIWLQRFDEYSGNPNKLTIDGVDVIKRVNDPADTSGTRKIYYFEVNKFKPDGSPNGSTGGDSPNGRFRSEISQATSNKRAAWGEERWEVTALKLTQDYSTLSTSDGFIIYQYHADDGADVANPPFSLRVRGKSGGGAELYAQLYKSSYPTVNGRGETTRQDAADQAFDMPSTSEWLYVVVNYRTGFNPAQNPTPFFKMWVAYGEEGKLEEVINYTGAWSYPGGNTGKANYTKHGIYYQGSTAVWSGTGAIATKRSVYSKGFGVIRPADAPDISKEQVLASIRNNTTITTPDPGDPPDGEWTEVAKEWGNFTINPGPKTVRFGTGSSWLERELTGTWQCNYVTFGGDPAVGQSKVCQVFETDIPTDPPDPTVDAWRVPPSWADWDTVPIPTEMGTLTRRTTALQIWDNPATKLIIADIHFEVPNGPAIVLGHGVWNVEIRNCRFSGCAVGSRDINHPAILLGGQATGGVTKIVNCFFEDNAAGVVFNGDFSRPTSIAAGNCRRAVHVLGNHFVRQRISYWGGTNHPGQPNGSSGGWIKGQQINFTRSIGVIGAGVVCRAAGNVINNWYDPLTIGQVSSRFSYIPTTQRNSWGGPMHAGPYYRGTTDQISIFECSGTAGNYVDIDSNIIIGAGWFNGTGIIIGDSVGRTTQYVQARRNRIYRTHNNGIQIAGGNNHIVTGNFIDSAGTSVESLTHVPIVIRLYNGKVNPGGHSITNNVVCCYRWDHNDKGAAHPGIAVDAGIPNVTQSGNTQSAYALLGERVYKDPWGSWTT